MSSRPTEIPATSQSFDRRRNPRHVTLLRAGILHVRGSGELCLVRNISSEGLMARVYAPVSEGDGVEVELKCGELISGAIVWEQEDVVGVQFAQAIDLDAVLTGRWVNETGVRSRQPRLKVDCPATLRCGARIHRGRLSDISAAGAKLILDTELTEADAVILTLTGLPPIAGVIRWVSGKATGLLFNELLSLNELARWRHGQSPANREGDWLLDQAERDLR